MLCLKKNNDALAGVLAAILLISVCGIGVSAQESADASPIQSCLGITVGTPAGLNLTATQYLGSKLGLRLSGGYLPGHFDSHLSGVQVGFLWKLREEGNSLFDAGIVFGYTEWENGRTAFDDNLWRYAGVAGAYKWKSLFVEGGLTVGSGTFSNPQGVLQVGVIFKTFRR